MLSDPKVLSLIQQYVEGEQPKSEASGNNGVSGNGSSQALVNGQSSPQEPEGQLVEIKFRAIKAGRYSLQLQCMSGDSRHLCLMPGTSVTRVALKML